MKRAGSKGNQLFIFIMGKFELDFFQRVVISFPRVNFSILAVVFIKEDFIITKYMALVHSFIKMVAFTLEIVQRAKTLSKVNIFT